MSLGIFLLLLLLVLLLLHFLLNRLWLLVLNDIFLDRSGRLAKRILASLANVAIFCDSALDHRPRDRLDVIAAAKDAQQVFDALRLRVVDLLLLSLLLDLLDLDLAQLHLVKLTLLLLLLLYNDLQVLLADLAISVLLQHAVLALDVGDLALLLIYDLLFVVSLLQQVLVDHLDGARGHLLLLFGGGGGELVDDLLVALLELLVVLNLRVKIFDDLLLNLVAHGQVALVRQSCITIKHHVHKRGHEAAHSGPEVLRLRLGLRQLRRRDLLRGIFVVAQARFKHAHLCLHLSEQRLGIVHLQLLVIDGCLDSLVECIVRHEGFALSNHAAQSELLILEQFRGESEEGALLEADHAHVKINRLKWGALLVLNQVQELVKCARQVLALFSTFLDEFGVQRAHISLHLRAVLRGNGSLDRVVSEAKVVENFIFEALVLGERRQHLRRHNVQDRLQEVEEANVGVLVSVKQVHVINGLEVLVLSREVKLLANEQNCNIAQFI